MKFSILDRMVLGLVGLCVFCILFSAIHGRVIAQQRVAENSLCLAYYLPESPVQNPFDIFDNLDDLSAIISSTLEDNRPIEKFIFKKREDFERFRPQNTIDFLVVDPIYFTQLQDVDTFDPVCVMKIDGDIVHSKDLVVLHDSTLKNMKDCHDKKIALTFSFREEKEFLENLYFKDYFDPNRYFKKMLKVDNSDSALLSVLYRDADAAFVPSYNQVYKENSNTGKIRKIFNTVPMINGIFAVNTQSISTRMIEMVREKMTKLHLQTEGRQVLLKSKLDAWSRTDRTFIQGFLRKAQQHPWSQPGSSMEPCYIDPDTALPSDFPSFPEPEPHFIVPENEPEPFF